MSGYLSIILLLYIVESIVKALSLIERKGRTNLYSVVLLKESTISEPKNKDDTKFFEESIILLNVKEAFFENKSPEALSAYFNEKLPPLEYMNGYGETVYSRIVRVIDYFQLNDPVDADDLTEVYSRFIVEKIGVTAEEVVNKYYKN